MRLDERLWGHITLLCIGSCLVGVTIGAYILSDPIADKWLYKWQSLIAGSFTMLAILFAWFSAEKAITANRTENRLVSDQAAEELEKLVAKRFEDIAAVWEMIEKKRKKIALAPTDQSLTSHIGNLSMSLSADIYAEFSPDLLPSERRRFHSILKNFALAEQLHPGNCENLEDCLKKCLMYFTGLQKLSKERNFKFSGQLEQFDPVRFTFGDAIKK